MFKKAKYGILAALLVWSCSFGFTQALTYSEISNPEKVLGDSTSTFYPYPTGTLVNDSGTIYFISGTTKVPFTNWQAFAGLGYKIKNVVEGDLTNYAPSSSYTINTANAEHPWGSWLIYKGTVYYSTQDGLIGVPNVQAFTSNGGDWTYIVKANSYDVAVLNANPNLQLLGVNDSRITTTPTYQFANGNNISTTGNTNTISGSATPSVTIQSPNTGGTLTPGQPFSYQVKLNSQHPMGAFNLLLVSNTTDSWPGTTGSYIPLVGANGYSATPSNDIFSGTIIIPNPLLLPYGTYYIAATWSNQDETQKLYSYDNMPFTFANPAGATSSSSSTTLHVSQDSSFTGSGTYNAGTNNTLIGSYVLTNPSSESVSISAISIQPGQSANLLTNLQITTTNEVQFGSTYQNLSANTNNNAIIFSAGNNPIVIPANGSAPVAISAGIYGNTGTGASNTTSFSGCKGTGQSSQTNYTCAFQQGQTITIGSAVGTQLSITANPNPSSVSSEPLTVGSAGVKIESFQLKNPTLQNISISSFYFSLIAAQTGSNPGFTPQNLKILVNGTLFGSGQPATSNSSNYLVYFSGTPLVISAGSQATIDVYGDVPSSTSAGSVGTIGLMTCSGTDPTVNYCSSAPLNLNFTATH